jgi:spore coat polysaccharide biosynthesis protein SpsF (cytidylyltransferase family)
MIIFGCMKSSTGIIIPTRLTSSRLPAKALLYLYKETVIERIGHACEDTGLPLVMAIPDDREHDIYAQVLDDMGFQVFRGHPTDCANRLYECAKSFGFEKIVRVTHDCPFIPSWAIRKLVDSFTGGYLSYEEHPGWDCEIFERELLRDVPPTEHVTTVLRTPGYATLRLGTESAESVCLDTPDDYIRILAMTHSDSSYDS